MASSKSPGLAQSLVLGEEERRAGTWCIQISISVRDKCVLGGMVLGAFGLPLEHPTGEMS